MQKTGLFDLLTNHIINNLVDYALGVEVGLDSNGRKNRGGTTMELLIENYIQRTYVKESYRQFGIKNIQDKWNIDLSSISNNGKSEKRFDFVVYANNTVFGIETNFYASGGSKLNETARSYKSISEATKSINGFEFIWFTDGKGWESARNNLQETFDVMEHIYNITDLENGIMNTIFGK
jgi:type II restriction enzyme